MLSTSAALVEESERGFFVAELDSVLHVEVKGALLKLVSPAVPGLDDGLVLRVVAETKERPGRARGEDWSKCQEQKPFIEAKLKDRVRLTKIRKLLRRRGVQLS